MRLDYHPAVQGDFNEAIAHYEAEGGTHLADRFETEFRACLAAIKSGPTRFSFYQKHSLLRRIRLKNFPYLILYRDKPDAIRVILLKHERRHPLFGLSRW
ncbi:MAG: hypothetical protein JWQ62_49 [Lacunisphaera sp.]|nr:hypothetical protein [Lacunisphaera sp.]